MIRYTFLTNFRPFPPCDIFLTNNVTYLKIVIKIWNVIRILALNWKIKCCWKMWLKLRSTSHETFFGTILRKKDKNILIFFRQRFQCPTKESSYKNTTYLVLCFVRAYLGWSIETYWQKSKHLFVATLCPKSRVWRRPKSAL